MTIRMSNQDGRAMTEVYVALWRVSYEGDSVIGIFTTEDEAREAADRPIYNNDSGSSAGVVECWPLNRTANPGTFGPPAV